MAFIKSKKQVNTLDATLRNFLSYMLSTRGKYLEELSHDYSEKERYEFIYNCVLNTIDEYIFKHRYSISSNISTKSLIRLFDENFMLRQFERNDISKDVSIKTQEIIRLFSFLKEPLNDEDKNNIMAEVNEIMTSTII
jgi:hypothetical protein